MRCSNADKCSIGRVPRQASVRNDEATFLVAPELLKAAADRDMRTQRSLLLRRIWKEGWSEKRSVQVLGATRYESVNVTRGFDVV